MKKIKPVIILIITVAALAAAAVMFYVISNRNPSVCAFKVLYIIFLTVFYQFAMRISVGEIITVIVKGRTFNYDSFWFKERKLEKKLYKLIKIKKWKQKLITAKPWQFNIDIRTPDELLFYITQAEIVHEIIMLLSFLPLLLIIRYGAPAVLIIISLIAFFTDGAFAAVQRYNRPRVRRLSMLKGE